MIMIEYEWIIILESVIKWHFLLVCSFTRFGTWANRELPRYRGLCNPGLSFSSYALPTLNITEGSLGDVGKRRKKFATWWEEIVKMLEVVDVRWSLDCVTGLTDQLESLLKSAGWYVTLPVESCRAQEHSSQFYDPWWDGIWSSPTPNSLFGRQRAQLARVVLANWIWSRCWRGSSGLAKPLSL